MDGSINEFHESMEKIETELGHDVLEKINTLLALFPKQHENHTQVVYQCLVTIIKLRDLGLEMYPGPNADLHFQIRDIEVKDHWK